MLKYISIKEDLKSRLMNAQWNQGDRLPSSRELSQYYDSSVNTVEKAFKELVEEGWLIRDGRRGTFMNKGEVPLHDRSRLVTAFVFSIENPLWASALRGVEDVLYSQKYHLISSSNDRNLEKLELLVSAAVEKKVEGVILSPVFNQGYEEVNNRIFSLLENNGIKIVCLARTIYNTDIPYVTSDNISGAYKLTKLLINQGHQRILFIRNSNFGSVSERLFGFKQAFFDSNIEYFEEFDVFVPTSFEDFHDEFDAYCQALEQKIKQINFTAVFTANDQIAEAAVCVLEKMEYNIPGDVSLVTYDALNLNQKIKLNVTGIVQPFYEMGQAAAKLLINLINRNEDPNCIGQVCKSKIYLGETVRSIST